MSPNARLVLLVFIAATAGVTGAEALRVGWKSLVQPPVIIETADSGTAVAQSRDPNPVALRSSPADAEVVVQVTGAVAHPQIVRLRAGSRVYEAIKIAGDVTAGADISSLDMAAPVVDGAKIVVPIAGAIASQRTRGKTGRASSGAAKLHAPADGRISLNQASAGDLERLPGVGPAMAERIVAMRSSIGKFRAVTDVGEVRGMGKKKMERILPFLTL